jgi:hypothetical protein
MFLGSYDFGVYQIPSAQEHIVDCSGNLTFLGLVMLAAISGN